MIFVLEDDNNIRELIVYTLSNIGLKTKGFSKPSEFWNNFKELSPELILLDIMLPEEDGMKVLRKLRSKSDTNQIPVIMITAKSSEFDKILGLDSGADDYITKPFSIMELISRIKALLRRTKKNSSDKPPEYNIGKLFLSPSKHIVKADGKDVQLTKKEYELLCMLVENSGIVLTRDKLLITLWGYDFDGESRTVDVHIRSLRSKLGMYGKYIQTIRGLGYKLGGFEDDQ